MGVKPANAAQKGVSPQSLAVGSMAKEYKKMLDVAGMKAKKRTKRTSHGLPSVFPIDPPMLPKVRFLILTLPGVGEEACLVLAVGIDYSVINR